MKLLLWGFLALAAMPKSCSQQNATCFKGRLEVKGMCGNYTIKLLEGKKGSWLQEAWTDEQTGKTYTGVFRLTNPCALPGDIKEGTEFYFTIDSSNTSRCTTCMAYYPTPEKAAAIILQADPCR